MRVILDVPRVEDLEQAARAAAYLLKSPPSKKDALLCYGESHTWDFYAKRTKSGVSVRRNPG